MPRVWRWVWSVLAIGAVLSCGEPARAQGVEVGGQATYLDLGVFGQSGWGVGARVGYETARLITLEGEVNVFDEQPTIGRPVQAMGGLKLGGRANAYGLFAKLRPGVLRFTEDFIMPGTACIAVVPTPVECLAARNNLILDFGSVLEIYPSPRSIIRFDIGTTYLWLGSRGDHPTSRNGNFQISLGGGWRF